MIEQPVTKQFLPQAAPRAYDGSERLPSVTDKTVLHYWRWAHTYILENVQRGVYAEYLVAAALNVTDEPRVGWAPYDLNFEGYKIEVKSSAYVQAWKQQAPSKITFGIGAKLASDPELPPETDPRHHADCFVFCVFADTDPVSADVLDASRWRFYVVPISRLIQFCGTAKTVVENRVKQITSSVTYPGLKDRIVETRQGVEFHGDSAAAQSPRCPNVALRNYAVWERGTRLHPVIVEATSADDAFILARADPILAKSVTEIAAQHLSLIGAQRFIAEGARDLR
jgi:hypothetical protein